MNWIDWLSASLNLVARNAVGKPVADGQQKPALRKTLPWLAYSAANTAQPRKPVTPFLVATNPTNTGTEPIKHLKTEGQPALRVLRIVDDESGRNSRGRNSQASSAMQHGRLRISGRACDVRAELERLAA